MASSMSATSPAQPVAGFEWGSGFYINPTPPEEAAKFLREASVEALQPAGA